MIIGFVKKKVIRDKEIKVIGCVKANKIYSDRIYIVGFLEALDEIRSREIFVKGGIKARKVFGNKILIFSNSQSTLLDVVSDFALLRGRADGKISTSFLRAKYAVLEWAYVNNIHVDKAKVYSGVMLDTIRYIGELIVRDPYISIRFEALNNIRKFSLLYNTYKYTF